jgi:hypothetical protein
MHHQAHTVHLPFAPQLQICLTPRTQRPHHARQLQRPRDGLCVKAQQHIPDANPGQRGRAIRLQLTDQRPPGFWQPEALGNILSYILDQHANTTTAHPPLLAQLRLHIHRHINRDGEGHSHEASRAAIDLGVDTHHFAGQIEQRPARISGVDGHIRLDERHQGLVRQGAPLGTDDPGRHRAVESER